MCENVSEIKLREELVLKIRPNVIIIKITEITMKKIVLNLILLAVINVSGSTNVFL
jgi:hypothetical protein